jgi:tRNA modification GTPase
VTARDTIAALATPPGIGGVAVVRVSGTRVPELATALCRSLPKPRHAVYRAFTNEDGSVIDYGLALYFPAPHSYTGEHVLELHAHGAPVVVDMLLKRLLVLGARLARPGEFSERAFLNGKLDLAQAEAVADLISAGSEAAARSAVRSLAGEFSRRVRDVVETLIRLRMHVEAAIDFPEEEIDFLADDRIRAQLDQISADINHLLRNTQQGYLLQSGMTLVLAGAPNSGKSSLLNALAQEDAAIVSPIAGTTRDVVRSRFDIDGMPIHILDTAGLRDSPDPIEREGMERARQAMTRADRVLLIIDDAATEPLSDAVLALLPDVPRTTVINKIDLTGRAAGPVSDRADTIALSAKTGAGLEALRNHLKQCMGFQPAGEGGFIARRRHIDAIVRARDALVRSRTALTERRAGELAAEELRIAQNALNEITGEFSADDLLGKIFSSFCIGK